MAKLIPTYLRRPSAILRIPQYLAQGLSPTAIIKEFTSLGITYRRTTMLSDIRSVSGVEAKKDRAKYIRRDRRPTPRSVADVAWDLSDEYMYKLAVQSRLNPNEPLTSRYINIESDKLLTPKEVEEQARQAWGTFEKYGQEAIESLSLVQVYHRIEPPQD